ncbi:MAG: serine/threonine-protein phosphatase [Lachnospiraceae bacterium]|nr:serine/threonine-protein phosphatase [Lachnospiraceae bacterium]
MKFNTAACSDIGISKKVNQDSYCIKSATTPIGNILMAVICDGMGGLEKGELASTSVTTAFHKWFESKLPQYMKNFKIEQVKNDWALIVEEQNKKILQYGEKENIRIGTTLTAMLIIDEYMMLICHVGDSRIYRIKEEAQLLTKDHTWIARELKHKRITEEEARNHPNRNMLLQCIGVLEHVVPDYTVRRIQEEEVYLLCTDGFRHKVSEKEFWANLNPEHLISEDVMEEQLKKLTAWNKKRNEKDNITSIVIKTVKDN